MEGNHNQPFPYNYKNPEPEIYKDNSDSDSESSSSDDSSSLDGIPDNIVDANNHYYQNIPYSIPTNLNQNFPPPPINSNHNPALPPQIYFPPPSIQGSGNTTIIPPLYDFPIPKNIIPTIPKIPLPPPIKLSNPSSNPPTYDPSAQPPPLFVNGTKDIPGGTSTFIPNNQAIPQLTSFMPNNSSSFLVSPAHNNTSNSSGLPPNPLNYKPFDYTGNGSSVQPPNVYSFPPPLLAPSPKAGTDNKDSLNFQNSGPPLDNNFRFSSIPPVINQAPNYVSALPPVTPNYLPNIKEFQPTINQNFAPPMTIPPVYNISTSSNFPLASNQNIPPSLGFNGIQVLSKDESNEKLENIYQNNDNESICSSRSITVKIVKEKANVPVIAISTYSNIISNPAPVKADIEIKASNTDEKSFNLKSRKIDDLEKKKNRPNNFDLTKTEENKKTSPNKPDQVKVEEKKKFENHDNKNPSQNITARDIINDGSEIPNNLNEERKKLDYSFGEYAHYTNEFLREFNNFPITKTFCERMCCRKETNLLRLKKLKHSTYRNNIKLIEYIRAEYKNLKSLKIEDFSVIDLYLGCSLIEIKELKIYIEKNDSLFNHIRKVSDESLKILQINRIDDKNIPRNFFNKTRKFLIDIISKPDFDFDNIAKDALRMILTSL